MSNLNHAAEGVRMTNQEIFDRVIAHLRKQGEPALDEDGNCRYRIEIDGRVLKCAVGCLIADEHYSKIIEGHGAGHATVSKALAASVEGDLHFGFLRALQVAHDFRWRDVGPSYFRDIAERYGLNTSALEGWA